MKRLLPYIAFAIAYIGFFTLVAWAVDVLDVENAGQAFIRWMPLVLAPFLLLACARLGTLTSSGVALTGLLIFVFVVSVAAFILDRLANLNGTGTTFVHFIRSFSSLLSIGGWAFWLDWAVTIGAPWAWSLFLFRDGQRKVWKTA